MTCPPHPHEPTHSRAYLGLRDGLGGHLGSRLVPPGQRGAEPLDLAEVDEEGALGAVHSEEGVAGVRRPAGTHPLQRGQPGPGSQARPPAPSALPLHLWPWDPEVPQDGNGASGAHPTDAAKGGAGKEG